MFIRLWYPSTQNCIFSGILLLLTIGPAWSGDVVMASKITKWVAWGEAGMSYQMMTGTSQITKHTGLQLQCLDETGVVAWEQTVTSPLPIATTSFHRRDGILLVTGSFENWLHVDGSELEAPMMSAFVLAFSLEGNLLWLMCANGDGHVQGMGLIQDQDQLLLACRLGENGFWIELPNYPTQDYQEWIPMDHQGGIKVRTLLPSQQRQNPLFEFITEGGGVANNPQGSGVSGGSTTTDTTETQTPTTPTTSTSTSSSTQN